VALASTCEVLRLVRVDGFVDIGSLSEGGGQGGTCACDELLPRGCAGVGMLARESVLMRWGRPVKNDKMDCWRLKVVFMGSGVAGIVDGCCAGLNSGVSVRVEAE
jgi:hypothetical protein